MIIMSSVNFLGWPLLSASLTPTIGALTKNQQFAYDFNVIEFQKKSQFNFDYRLTKDPYINQAFIDLFLHGEITSNN